MKKIPSLIWPLLSILSLPITAYAAELQTFHHSPATPILQKFAIAHPGLRANGVIQKTALRGTQNSLQAEGSPHTDKQTQQTHQRYQQLYYGVPVLGAIVVTHSKNNHSWVNGNIIDNIHLSYQQLRTLQQPAQANQALQKAITTFRQSTPTVTWCYQHEQATLQIVMQQNQAIPVYHVQFYAAADKSKPQLIHMIIDANDQTTIYKQWNDMPYYHYDTHTYEDIGLGGNQNTGPYHYGQAEIPKLVVKQILQTCIMENPHVKLVNLFGHAGQDYYGTNHYVTPFHYRCGDPYKDFSPNRGAFSPADDAYFFGTVVYDMYQQWYDTTVLPYQLIVRIHRHDPDDENSNDFDNAFWNPYGKTMNFGDGDPVMMYPLISLEIMGHEVSHGFTEEHANMAYHDQSGSLNESFSDMAGIAANQYLLTTNPSLYHAHYQRDDIEWATGRNIMRNFKPFRFFDHPARDGLSAECFEPVAGCKINYAELQSFIHKLDYPDMVKQMILVHSGSGIFNKAFFELAHEPTWNIKKAFEVMLVANRDGYWTPGSFYQQNYFNDSACGVVNAANALHYPTAPVLDAFHKVGLLLKTNCSV